MYYCRVWRFEIRKHGGNIRSSGELETPSDYVVTLNDIERKTGSARNTGESEILNVSANTLSNSRKLEHKIASATPLTTNSGENGIGSALGNILGSGVFAQKLAQFSSTHN